MQPVWVSIEIGVANSTQRYRWRWDRIYAGACIDWWWMASPSGQACVCSGMHLVCESILFTLIQALRTWHAFYSVATIAAAPQTFLETSWGLRGASPSS